jgi:hypothetical protein
MNWYESEGLPIQRLVAGDVGSADEAAVQRVGPGVVHALNRGTGVATRLQAEPCPTVAADVEERTQLAIPSAHDQHALPGQLDGLEVARRGQRVGTADTGPHLTEQALLLACVDVRVVEVPAGQRGLERHTRLSAHRIVRLEV